MLGKILYTGQTLNVGKLALQRGAMGLDHCMDRASAVLHAIEHLKTLRLLLQVAATPLEFGLQLRQRRYRHQLYRCAVPRHHHSGASRQAHGSAYRQWDDHLKFRGQSSDGHTDIMPHCTFYPT